MFIFYLKMEKSRNVCLLYKQDEMGQSNYKIRTSRNIMINTVKAISFHHLFPAIINCLFEDLSPTFCSYYVQLLSHDFLCDIILMKSAMYVFLPVYAFLSTWWGKCSVLSTVLIFILISFQKLRYQTRRITVIKLRFIYFQYFETKMQFDQKLVL